MTDTAPSVEIRSEPCPECGETISAPAKGPGSFPFKMGSHRYRIHGIKGSGEAAKRPKAARGRTAQTDEELASHPVAGTLRDARDQIPTGTGPPSQTDLTRGLGRGLGIISMAVAGYAVETDRHLTDAQRDEVAAELSLSPTQANDVVRPLAKAIAPTSLNRRYGRQVVENVDAVSSIAELVTLGLHWRRYFRDRAIRDGRREAIEATAVARPIPVPPGDGGVPPPVGPGVNGAPVEGRAPATVTTSPAGHEGMVVSAEHVEELRRRGRTNGAAS